MKKAGEKRFWYCRKVQGGGDLKKPLALGFLGRESAKSQGVTVKARVPQVAYAAGALESAPDW